MATDSCSCVNSANTNNRRPSEECIIAKKLFDQCRIQKCLTPDVLGPARALCDTCACGRNYQEGDIIVPPCNATNVLIKNFRLCRIEIRRKTPNPFREGFWDVDIHFVFAYQLVFYTSGNCELCTIDAYSSYNTKVTLFGAPDTGIVVMNELSDDIAESGPFVSVEASAMPLAAELHYPSVCGCCGCGCNSGCGCGNNSCGCDDQDCAVSDTATSVDITIGLFGIVKIFRCTNLLINVLGSCIPEECALVDSATDPCTFFNNLQFPIDLFSPQKGDEGSRCC